MGNDLIAFMSNEPEKWGMNLLVKVLKYSNYELLGRNDDEWNALDTLIRMRRAVADKSPTQKIAQRDASTCFENALQAFGFFTVVGMQEVQALQNGACLYCLCICCFMAQSVYITSCFYLHIYLSLNCMYVHRKK